MIQVSVSSLFSLFFTSENFGSLLIGALVRFKKINTVELQWLEHLWNHENMFETGVVRAIECYSKLQVRRHNRDIFSIFFNMKVCCVFSLKSPHRGDFNEYIQHTIINIKKGNPLKLSQI